jgi:poly-gamma-glutamate capsule biosynthesis protein CapA/YwtB (metallophosphatase superfamily)
MSVAGPNDLVLFAMGDRVCNRDDYQVQWEALLPLLREADLRYCQVEQVFSDRGTPCVSASNVLFRVSPKYAAALKYTGIDVGSPIGNHAMSYGHEAIIDTVATLEANGVRSFGAGKDIAEARKPAILEKKGTRIAFLGYNSIIGIGEAADVDWPGVAPMRIHTYYEPLELNQPGMPPRIRTFPEPRDMAAMQDDIRKARQLADVVAVAFHFGIHYKRAELSEYQPVVAHAAVDSGADLILGSHPHLLKAIEVYKGKAIFYSLGNFSCDPLGRWTKAPQSAIMKTMIEAINRKVDSEYPFLLNRPRDVMKTGIAKIVISNKKISRVSLIPMVTTLDRYMQPLELEPGSEKFKEMVDYVKDITRESGIGTEFKVEGKEIVVAGI